MCDTCGCGDPNLVPVEVHESLFAANDRVAAHNREHFRGHGVLALNLMGSPGSGKTAVLEATARARTGIRIAAVSGDLATDLDARRLEAAGIPARTITTGSACHLDAEMIHRALHHVDLDQLDVFVVENVGNLVCPADFDLGEAVRVVLLSVTEGEDKPLKYPPMFFSSDLAVITKIDIADAVEFDRQAALTNLERVHPGIPVLEVSAKKDIGMEAWLDLLAQRLEAFRAVETVTD